MINVFSHWLKTSLSIEYKRTEWRNESITKSLAYRDYCSILLYSYQVLIWVHCLGNLFATGLAAINVNQYKITRNCKIYIVNFRHANHCLKITLYWLKIATAWKFNTLWVVLVFCEMIIISFGDTYGYVLNIYVGIDIRGPSSLNIVTTKTRYSWQIYYKY